MAETHSTIDSDTFATYSDTLQAAALATTRLAATSLPADLSFHRSIDPTLARDVDTFSDRVLALTNKLIHIASGKTSGMREEEEILDEFVRNILDPMEGMLESTDGALDVFLGRRKDPAIHLPLAPVDLRQKKAQKPLSRGRLDPTIVHASRIPKPQLLFRHMPSNTDESPYIPATLMAHKWCAVVPLGYIFHEERLEHNFWSVHEDDDEEQRKKRALHPYYYELTHPSYPDHVFNPPAKPVLPIALDAPSSGGSTAFQALTVISTPKAFLSMANTISSETELAVDLEHHSYRSYRGFLALMQISTRQADFIIDLLVPEIREGLRQAKGKGGDSQEARMASDAGQIIARVFADPSITKIFHGAESDIVWLQQDFNIFVVGLFDTYHASKLLGFLKHSLAHLLETYCDFIPDKRYQLADWRIRPLPAEMLTYARSDTHFLIYTYDMLRISLIERPSTESTINDETSTVTNTQQIHHGHDLIRAVLDRSARTALRLYETEVYDTGGGTGSNGWDTLARKWNKTRLVGTNTLIQGAEVQPLPAAVYKAVHRWREAIAREEDESTRYVLPTHHLFLLAERTPTTIPDFLSLFGGSGGVNGNVPPVLKRRTGELVSVIKEAVEATNATSANTRDGSPMVISAAIKESGVTSPTASPPAPKPSHESRLWALSPSSTSMQIISSPSSSLFGVGMRVEHAQKEEIVVPPSVDGEKIYLARKSVLFGSESVESAATSSSRMTKPTFTSGEVSGETAERFKDLVERIHKTLVIAPVVSVPSASIQGHASKTSASGVSVNAEKGYSSILAEVPDIPPGPVGQIEIPFVPAHKRQTLLNSQNHEPTDDTIVVVGQAGRRQRKRKRDKARISQPGAQSSGAETSAYTNDRDQEVEEFDYASVPNLLDNESKNADTRDAYEEEKSRKKQKHGKGSGLFEYGDFRAPPRDQREVRSGNKTHTFR